MTTFPKQFEPSGKARFVIHVGRFCNALSSIRTYCWMHDLECDVTQLSSGLFARDYAVEIRGRESALLRFKSAMYDLIPVEVSE